MDAGVILGICNRTVKHRIITMVEITMTDIRREAEAFLDARPMSIPITEEPECVDALVGVIKAQRRQEVEALRQLATESLTYHSLILRLDQRKNELE